jgi:chromosome segregation ATPase
MPRELHPELFGDRILTEASEKVILDPLESLRRRVRNNEIQTHALQQKVDKIALSMEQKTAQIQNNIKNFETQMKTSLQELQAFQSTFSTRLNDHKTSDHRIQDLVDRHNIIVQQFEQRMQGLQKVTSEQEYKLLTYKNTLNEILSEIKNLR